MTESASDNEKPWMGYLSVAAALAGVVAGLTVALRDVLVIMTWAHLRQAGQFFRDAGLLALADIAVGLVLGIAAGALLALLRQVAKQVTHSSGASLLPRLGVVALGAFALILRIMIVSGVGQTWLDIGIVALALVAVAPAQAGRSDRVAWMARAGIVTLLVVGVFMVGHALVNDLQIALRVVGYSVLLVLAGWLGFIVNGWVRGPVEGLAGRIGPWRLAGGAVAIALIPMLVLGAWYFKVEGSVVARKIAALATGGATGASAEGTHPDILLISVDTLRADAPSYAGGDASTPVMDALAEESFVFERAYSVAPWTRPSFASFFSSLYPSEMGVARIRGVDTPGSEIIPYRWREEPVTLTEALHDSGYRTAAVVTNGQLTSEAAADQGFELFHNCKLDAERQMPARAMRMVLRPPCHRYDYERADYLSGVTARVLPNITRPPALIWLHYMDPHFPYDPPTLDPARRIHHEEKASVIARLSTRSTAAMAGYIEAYNAEVEYFDQWLGNVIEMFKDNGLWASAIVVFWSDHGEEFWEHGSWEHGHSLYDELLHVPLMIHMPGQTEGERVSEPVSLLDVMPTLLDLAGVSGPDEMRGRSLTPTLSVRPDTLDPMHLFLEACSWGDIRKGLFTGRYKLIYDLYHDRFSLYDLQDDPGELRDIFGTEMAPDTRELEEALLDWTDYSLALMQQRVETGREELSPEARQHLKDMGYIQ